MPKRDPAKLTKVNVSLPYGIGKAEWTADPTERRAAWSLHVELGTRIATQPLGHAEGLLREALASLHALFPPTRDILKEAGPDVGARRESVGGIATCIRNKGLRPLLAKWHPELHERAWEHEPMLRGELEQPRGQLDKYATTLTTLAGVKD